MPNTKPVGVAYSDPDLTELYLNGTQVTADAGELNKLDGVTATTAEINALAGEIASVSQVSTPASGSNGTQFTFKNAAGVAVSGVRTMLAYISTDAGVQAAAVDGLAVLTNGGLTELVTGKTCVVTTTSAGLLGVTLTESSASSYYLSFVLPNGRVITSTALVVN